MSQGGKPHTYAADSKRADSTTMITLKQRAMCPRNESASIVHKVHENCQLCKAASGERPCVADSITLEEAAPTNNGYPASKQLSNSPSTIALGLRVRSCQRSRHT